MHPLVKQLVNLYPLVKKFPLPVAMMMFVVGSMLNNYTLIIIGMVITVWKVWEYAYTTQQLRDAHDAEDAAKGQIGPTAHSSVPATNPISCARNTTP